MRKFAIFNRFFTASFIVMSLTACGAVKVNSTESWQGKIWRAMVLRPMVDTSTLSPDDRDLIQYAKYDEKRDNGYRTARIIFSSEGRSIIANAKVPDSIEFAEIPRGTVVDVMVEKGPDTDYSVQRFSRILWIICASNDTRCLTQEDRAGRLKGVVDEYPGNVSIRYPLKFDRRLSEQDLKEFD